MDEEGSRRCEMASLQIARKGFPSPSLKSPCKGRGFRGAIRGGRRG